MRFLLAALVAGTFLRAVPAAADDTKVGYVDIQRAINEIEEGRKAKASLKSEFERRQRILDDKQEELKKLKADLDRQASAMSEDARRKKQEELQQKFFELQGTYAKLQKELNDQEAELTQTILRKMEGIVTEIAKAEGFTYIFEKNDAGIVYAPPSHDVTNEVVRRYNQQHKSAKK